MGKTMTPALTLGGLLCASYLAVAPQAMATATAVATAIPMNADLRAYGVVGDGASDDSQALQKAIDAHKGKTIVIPADMHILAAGIRLDGPAYDGTTLQVDGSFKLLPDQGRANLSGAWIGLIVRDCSDVTITGHFDGNRSNMNDREHIFLIALAGTHRTKIPNLDITEIRGDGLYVSSLNFSAESRPTDNLTIGTMKVSNSDDDGRNAVSLISAVNVSIDNLDSQRVGAVVERTLQPGGFDIEPSHPWQQVKDVHIGTLRVLTAANSGLGIIGSAQPAGNNAAWNVSRVTIDYFSLVRTGKTPTGVLLIRSSDLTLKGSVNFHDVHGAAVAGGSFTNAHIKLTSVTNAELAGIANRGPVNASTIEYAVRKCTEGRPRQTTPGLTISPLCNMQ
jgi:hypothetical protein